LKEKFFSQNLNLNMWISKSCSEGGNIRPDKTAWEGLRGRSA